MEIPSYFKVLATSQKQGSAAKKLLLKALLVLEIVVVTFLCSLVPDLIALGRPPTDITEVWGSILSAFLVALYAYARVRGIEIPDIKEEEN